MDRKTFVEFARKYGTLFDISHNLNGDILITTTIRFNKEGEVVKRD